LTKKELKIFIVVVQHDRLYPKSLKSSIIQKAQVHTLDFKQLQNPAAHNIMMSNQCYTFTVSSRIYQLKAFPFVTNFAAKCKVEGEDEKEHDEDLAHVDVPESNPGKGTCL